METFRVAVQKKTRELRPQKSHMRKSCPLGELFLWRQMPADSTQVFTFVLNEIPKKLNCDHGVLSDNQSRTTACANTLHVEHNENYAKERKMKCRSVKKVQLFLVFWNAFHRKAPDVYFGGMNNHGPLMARSINFPSSWRKSTGKNQRFRTANSKASANVSDGSWSERRCEDELTLSAQMHEDQTCRHRSKDGTRFSHTELRTLFFVRSGAGCGCRCAQVKTRLPVIVHSNPHDPNELAIKYTEVNWYCKCVTIDWDTDHPQDAKRTTCSNQRRFESFTALLFLLACAQKEKSCPPDAGASRPEGCERVLEDNEVTHSFIQIVFTHVPG